MARDPISGAPRILCIAGSPRRHGNSERLLDACAAGVESAGGLAETLVVVERDIRPCQGCNACSSTGECVVQDGMQSVYPMLDAAAAIAISSPVYFATVPAVLKALYDRCQPYWARTHVLHEPPPARRQGALMLVRGGGDPYGFQAAVYTTKSVFAGLGVDYAAELKVEGPDSPSDIGRHPDALRDAAEIGAQMVRTVLHDGDALECGPASD
ncbi:MAG: flavodoxin family protein [Actinomycetota bacterium]|nr:flavodoxin family protein [Actinomycetota bacterium]